MFGKSISTGLSFRREGSLPGDIACLIPELLPDALYGAAWPAYPTAGARRDKSNKTLNSLDTFFNIFLYLHALDLTAAGRFKNIRINTDSVIVICKDLESKIIPKTDKRSLIRRYQITVKRFNIVSTRAPLFNGKRKKRSEAGIKPQISPPFLSFASRPLV